MSELKDWKSPRQIEQETADAAHEYFEELMDMVDHGVITRELAKAAFLSDETLFIPAPTS